MSALRVLSVLSGLLALAVCAPQTRPGDAGGRDFSVDLSDPFGQGARSDGSGSSGGGSLFSPSRGGNGDSSALRPFRGGNNDPSVLRPFLGPTRGTDDSTNTLNPFLKPSRRTGDSSIDLKPFVSPSQRGDSGLLSLFKGGERPKFPISGPAGSPAAATNLAGSAAHGDSGVSGGTKGVGIRVFQSANQRVSVGAGFSSNLKGANAGGLHVAVKLD